MVLVGLVPAVHDLVATLSHAENADHVSETWLIEECTKAKDALTG
mgnify:CR=1 FL=1